jgi:predicted enzyme related to lactoylglutathione lyase
MRAAELATALAATRAMPFANAEDAATSGVRHEVAAMRGAEMLRGLATISFWAEDLKAARAWYSELLGIEPYFERPDADNPAYIEFRLGDYQDELGIIDAKYAPHDAASPGGVIVYWHVDDVAATLERLTAMGAKVYEPLTPRGDAGWVTASVVDPFGNILGIMFNPHYLEILGANNTT